MTPNIPNNCAAAFILAMVGIWRREENSPVQTRPETEP